MPVSKYPTYLQCHCLGLQNILLPPQNMPLSFNQPPNPLPSELYASVYLEHDRPSSEPRYLPIVRKYILFPEEE